MLTSQTCQNCKFWITGPQVVQQMRAAGIPNTISQPGYCVFNPPVAPTSTTLRWPVTVGSEACGSWTAQPTN